MNCVSIFTLFQVRGFFPFSFLSKGTWVLCSSLHSFISYREFLFFPFRIFIPLSQYHCFHMGICDSVFPFTFFTLGHGFPVSVLPLGSRGFFYFFLSFLHGFLVFFHIEVSALSVLPFLATWLFFLTSLLSHWYMGFCSSLQSSVHGPGFSVLPFIATWQLYLSLRGNSFSFDVSHRVMGCLFFPFCELRLAIHFIFGPWIFFSFFFSSFFFHPFFSSFF